MQKSLILVAVLIATPSISKAQFWHALPPVDTNHTLSACFSNDEKKVFYLAKDGGVANILGMTVADKYGRIIAGPTNPPVQITKFTDHGIVRFFHLLNRPEILYMRLADDGKDYHIYRIKDDGSGQPDDLTPGEEGVTSEIIGASYNGRFVYFTNNKVSRDKVDVYRYDTQQFSSDLVFPNDKNYVALAWTRDQKKLLIEDSSANSLMFYDIETTERTPVPSSSDQKISAVMLDPVTLKIQVFYLVDGKQIPLPTDYSPNCKYIISGEPGKWAVKDVATDAKLNLPEGYCPLSIAPKETMLIYSLPSSGNASKIFLYDIAKNSSTELATVR
jgi:hypothetical protein